MTGNEEADGRARIHTGEAARERDLEAARLRALRFSHDQIAERLGYENRSGAWKAVRRGQELIVREPHEDMVLLDLTELDEMARAAWTVLRNTHYVVDRGEVVTWNNQPLMDDAPVLAAIRTLLDVQQRRARLVGLDAPKRLEVSEGISDLDAAVRDLMDEIATRGTGSEVPAE